VALGAGRSWVFPRGESLARSQSPRQCPMTSPSPRTGGPNVDHFAGLRPSRVSSLGLVGRSPCRRFWPAHSGPRCLVSLDQESHAPTPRAQTHMPSRKGHSPQGQAHVAPEPRRRPAVECGCFSFQFVSLAHPACDTVRGAQRTSRSPFQRSRISVRFGCLSVCNHSIMMLSLCAPAWL
jgi:hypothetical protein